VAAAEKAENYDDYSPSLRSASPLMRRQSLLQKKDGYKTPVKPSYEVIDIASNKDFISHKLTTEDQLATLKAI